jgi:hypothetical protein
MIPMRMIICEAQEIIARGESERAGDEQAANIDLNLDG